jgi:hypothetical protein
VGGDGTICEEIVKTRLILQLWACSEPEDSSVKVSSYPKVLINMMSESWVTVFMSWHPLLSRMSWY